MTWLTDPLVLARFVHFTACAVTAGTAIFVVLAAGPAASVEPLRRRWSVLIRASAAISALSGLAWFVVVAANIVGQPLPGAMFHGALWSTAFDTHFGRLALARIALALLLVLPVWPQFLRVALALGLIVLIAPAGHAGARPGSWGWVQLGADSAHLVAAAGWLGGLPAFAILLGATYRKQAMSRDVAACATARFSSLGFVAVATLIATGAINSTFLLSSPWDLLTTLYGRILSLKIALFIAMIGIAAVNRFHLTPRLADASAIRALWRNSLLELCLGLGVLFLVAILGTQEPGAHHHAGAAPSGHSAFVHGHGPEPR